MADKARLQPALAIDALAVVRWETLGLHLLAHPLAFLFFRVVVLEIGRVECLDQGQVQDTQVDRRFVALVAVIMPGVVRRQHHVAGAECDVFAFDAGEVHGAGQAEPDGVRRMTMRRHDLIGIVQPVGRVHGRDRGAAWRQARVDQDQRTALRRLCRDQFGRAVEQRFDLIFVAPDVRDRFLLVLYLPVFVVVGAASTAQNGAMLRRSTSS